MSRASKVLPGAISDTNLTYTEFTSKVHEARSSGLFQNLSLTEAFIQYLQLVKPFLAVKAIKHVDPRLAPFPLKEFLDYVKTNWENFNRPKSETY